MPILIGQPGLILVILEKDLRRLLHWLRCSGSAAVRRADTSAIDNSANGRHFHAI